MTEHLFISGRKRRVESIQIRRREEEQVASTVIRDGQRALVSQCQFRFRKGNFRGVVAAVVGRGRRSSERVARLLWIQTDEMRPVVAAGRIVRRRVERVGMGRWISVRLLVFGFLLLLLMMLLEIAVVVAAAALRWLRPPATMRLLVMTGRIARRRTRRLVPVLALFGATQIRIKTSDGPVELVDRLAP